MTLNRLSVAALAVILVSYFVAVPQSRAAKLGVVGDGLSDEYAEETYSYASGWVEQLVTNRGIDVGSTGAWGEPRRNGYEYNWARRGATSTSLLTSGQHAGLASQVPTEGIDYAVVMIGNNDQFDVSNAYAILVPGLPDRLTVG